MPASSALAADEKEHKTATPIKHVVVIFQENVSFDHYFATYPVAANPTGEPHFHARRGTPTVNGLSGALLTHNLNLVNPFRFDRSHAATCDQDHDYGDEQKAFDHGIMDQFVQTVGTGPGTDGILTCNKTDVMGYFDGNTVTALWNYAQHFAMSDNSFGTTFGPSTPGALNLVSGQTNGATGVSGDTSGDLAGGSVIGDPQPAFDKCSTRETASLAGRNIGDLLNDKSISWGWFQGGFRDCSVAHTGSDGIAKKDYIPHHEPFQYYKSTSNPNHLPPTSTALIGHAGDQANHQYDITDFWAAVSANNFPEVSFLKAPGFQDGHAGYSDPLAEQTFLVETINRLQASREWEETAVIISYDDSDGWYDHVMSPIVSPSNTSADTLNGPGNCGTSAPGSQQGKCGFGPRLPLLVISPYAKNNFVDGALTDQSSILRFIEDNWGVGRIGGGSSDDTAGTLFHMFDFSHPRNHRLFLDPSTGQPADHDGDGDDD
ncbi:MAG TPA: alkaline phosphatase family protein [Candidatus Angelobacter sp.]|nr:alkaline phosphatase family protein [Candidatus Angelobacter sp.]